MKDSVKKLLLLGGVVAAIVIYFLIKSLGQVDNFRDKYEGFDLTADVEGVVRDNTYSQYLTAHADAAYPEQDIVISLADYVSGDGIEIYDSYEGVDDVLFTDDLSTVTWEIQVPASGFYNVYLEYMTVESRGVAIERALYVNGELPFDGANDLLFTRLWADAGEPKVDNQGNEIRPMQVEVYDWQSGYCRDSMGYIAEPYQFYLE